MPKAWLCTRVPTTPHAHTTDNHPPLQLSDPSVAPSRPQAFEFVDPAKVDLASIKVLIVTGDGKAEYNNETGEMLSPACGRPAPPRLTVPLAKLHTVTALAQAPGRGTARCRSAESWAGTGRSGWSS